MGTKKITITLPDEVIEYIKGHVDPRGVSGYVTAAVEHKVAMDKLTGLSEFLDEEFGPLTEEELSTADARLDAMDAWHLERRHEGEAGPLEGKAAA
ncbi:hypothetical protein OHA37_21260 [Streptomyces sp. NBC_00335]|uniref:hypothetical protein n=1 Tax=unclassified Streptomyces TaxID=2593676 RepID=UPI002254D1E3|nr:MULTISPECIES: hypothetical protein [unclassified Streptomyces]MCX5406391.1 hypothetical protein [Streptomyces sp. NBC_00086]